MATLAALLSLSACGGSGDDSLTKAEFVKQGNAICKKDWQEERSRLFRQLSVKLGEKTVSAADKEEAVLKLISPYEQTTARLAELSTPEGEEEKVDSMIKAMNDAVKKVKAEPEAALTNTAPFEGANQAVKNYGLTECTV
jgi:hypothetical protein